MVEEKQDEIVQEPSPEIEDVEVESSTTEEEEPQQELEQEPGPVPYDRFDQVNQQKNEAKQEAEYWRTQAMQVTEKLQQPGAPAPTQQEIDIIQKYGSQDANTREFLRDIREDMTRQARKVGEEMAAPIQRENEALRRTVATMQEKLFRQENTDVAQGSKEEAEIAQYVRMGMPLEKATKAVMYDKRITQAEKVGQVRKTDKTKAKVNANLETRTIPQTSGIPQGEKLSFRQDLDRTFREAGI